MKQTKRLLAWLLALTLLMSSLPGLTTTAQAAATEVTEATEPTQEETIPPMTEETVPETSEATIPEATEASETTEATVPETIESTVPETTTPMVPEEENITPVTEETTAAEETTEPLIAEQVITAFAQMDEEILLQALPVGAAEADVILPEELTVTVDGEELVLPVTWKSETPFESTQAGMCFAYSPILPEGYVLAEGISLPQLQVMVAEPVAVLAEPATSGKCGENLTWTLDEKGTLTVSGTGEMYSGLSEYEWEWYELKDSIKCVVLEPGVTTVGAHAFWMYLSLTKVVLPEGLTRIDDYAFSSCSNLNEVNLPEGLEQIGTGAFCYCDGLEEVTIPGSVNTIGENAFSAGALWVDESNPNYCNDSFGVLYNKDKTRLIHAGSAVGQAFTIPNSVTTVGKNAFSNTNGVNRRIIVPSSVTLLEERAFSSFSLQEIFFLGSFPAIEGAENTTVIIQPNTYSTTTVFYPSDNATWTEAARAKLAAQNPEKFVWIPFDTSRSTSGTCGEGLNWSVDTAAKTLTISGSGSMDAWDFTTAASPWVYYGEQIKTVIIQAGVKTISDNAFRYTNVKELRFEGSAPAFGSGVLENGMITAYYPAGDASWEPVVQRYPAVSWIQEGSTFASLHEIVLAHESMSADEIRAAVQALDQQELLEGLRSGAAYGDFYTLSAAVQADWPKVIFSPAVPKLYVSNTSVVGNGMIGASLNPLSSPDKIVTAKVDASSEEIPVPAGYDETRAIQFSLSIDNVLNPEELKVPIYVYMLIPDDMSPYFQEVFWRNNKTGQIEKSSCSASWSKMGTELSFVITGTGDFMIAPKKDAVAKGTCGDNLFWSYDGSHTLTISGSGNMYDYGESSNLPPWYYYHEDITQIVIGEGVTGIGSYAFYGCRFTDSVTIPASVRKIGEGAFGYMFSTYAVFEGDLPQVGSAIFKDNNHMERIYYPAGNATWESVVGTASWCGAENLTWIPIGTSGTCGDHLTWNFDVETGTLTVKGTGKMQAYGLENTPPWEPYNERIQKIVLSDGVESIGANAFLYCANVTELSISNTVTSIDGWCINAGKISEITIPAGVKKIDPESGIGYAKKITVAPENTAYSSKDGVLFNKDQTELILYPCKPGKAYTVPDGVTSIGSYAFCGSPESLNLPDSLTAIQERAFFNCTGLTELDIPDSVKTIGDSAFMSCTGLTSITFGKGVTDIGENAMEYCEHLQAIVFKGDAPSFGRNWLPYQEITICHPANNSTWTNELKQSCGEKITWKESDGTNGDLNGDGTVNEDDAIYLLLYLALPELYELHADGNIDSKNGTNEDDAIYLLLYLSLPEAFPLYP